MNRRGGDLPAAAVAARGEGRSSCSSVHGPRCQDRIYYDSTSTWCSITVLSGRLLLRQLQKIHSERHSEKRRVAHRSPGARPIFAVRCRASALIHPANFMSAGEDGQSLIIHTAWISRLPRAVACSDVVMWDGLDLSLSYSALTN
jgi:hypothetical protein